MVLPTGVLFLSAFFNYTLFLQVDSNFRETFICLSINNNNETWPSTWKRMDKDDKLFTYKIDDNFIRNSTFIKYKLRFYFIDGKYIQTDKWYQLYAKQSSCSFFTCMIAFTILLIFFICLLGYLLFRMYLYYKYYD